MAVDFHSQSQSVWIYLHASMFFFFYEGYCSWLYLASPRIPDAIACVTMRGHSLKHDHPSRNTEISRTSKAPQSCRGNLKDKLHQFENLMTKMSPHLVQLINKLMPWIMNILIVPTVILKRLLAAWRNQTSGWSRIHSEFIKDWVNCKSIAGLSLTMSTMELGSQTEYKWDPPFTIDLLELTTHMLLIKNLPAVF